MAWQNSGALLELLTCALQQGNKSYGHKGLGKGLQAGNGKEKAKEKSPDFLCRIKGCRAADHGLNTKHGKSTCFVCGVPKNKAMNPPKAETTLWVVTPSQKSGASSSAKDKDKGKGGGKGAQGKSSAAAPKPPVETPKVTVSSDSAEVIAARVPGGTPPEAIQPAPPPTTTVKPKERWQPRQLPCAVVDAMNRFQEEWHCMVDSTAADLFPTEEAIPTPAEVLDGLLAEDREAGQTNECSKLQKEVTTL